MLFVARFMCLVNFVFVIHEVYGQRKSEFRFTTQKTHSLNPSSSPQGSCHVCYGSDDCVGVAASWCEYYQRTTSVLAEEKEQETAADPVLKAEVDTALYNLLKTAAEDESFTECIPYVSQYTNCDKESICSGCQSCSCDGGGRWRCAPRQGCEPGVPRRDVDRRLMQRAMERLAGRPASGTHQDRVKRSFRDLARLTGRGAWMDELRLHSLSTVRPSTSPLDDEGNSKTSNVTDLKDEPTTLFNTLARWMQSVRPRSMASISVTPDREEIRNIIRTIFEDMQNKKTIGFTLFATEKLNDDLGLENFSFNELLSNFSMNNTGYNMTNKDHDSSDFTKLLSEMEGLGEAFEEITTVTYENFYKNMPMLKKAPDYFFSSGNVNYDLLDNDISSDRSTRILKRDVVNGVNETTSNTNVTVNSNLTAADNLKKQNSTLKVLDSNNTNLLKHKTDDDVQNISKTQKDMNENVLSPLADIIIEKQNELAELLNIRKHLIKNIKSNKNLNFSSNIADDLKENKTHFEMYKLEILPELSRNHGFVDKLEISPESSRGQSELNKYMDTLNNDVLKMVLEISAIQRLSKEQIVIIPNNFKTLSNAIKLYIQELKDSKDKIEIRDVFNSSNNLKNERDEVKGVASYIESGFLNVFEIMDKNKHTSNILGPLSKNAKTILKRLILSLTDSINSNDIKLAEKTQLISKLKKAQYEWKKIEERPRNTHVSDSLHDLKLKHLAVTCMVNELIQLLYQINFFQSHRMIPLDLDEIETTVNEISQTIESKIGSIHDYFNNEKLIASSTSSSMFSDDSLSTTTKPQGKKRRKLFFMKRLKKLIMKFMPKKKIPRQTEEIHKAKLMTIQKDISDWENAQPRNKRSPHGPPEKVKFKLQNILPKYLRRRFHHNGLKKNTKNSLKKGRSKREVPVPVMVTQLPWWVREEQTQFPWWRNHTRVTIVNRARLQRRPQKHAQKKKGIFSVLRDRIAEFFSG
ncbi:unnamed protein product [Plutella xylostella]|uniref:(diamondback moth) hypothetical protein n=1 Tax=Plutella xylostella TaxID=51655 RepID=A0A8S4FUA6_PLUXY|nr:unnamed protein product [Plutella xylostella]